MEQLWKVAKLSLAHGSELTLAVVLNCLWNEEFRCPWHVGLNVSSTRIYHAKKSNEVQNDKLIFCHWKVYANIRDANSQHNFSTLQWWLQRLLNLSNKAYPDHECVKQIYVNHWKYSLHTQGRKKKYMLVVGWTKLRTHKSWYNNNAIISLPLATSSYWPNTLADQIRSRHTVTSAWRIFSNQKANRRFRTWFHKL